MEANLFQVIVAIIAIAPGIVSLFIVWRKNKADARSAERDDNREDFTALFDAARQLGDAGTALVEPLTRRVQELKAEMERRDAEHGKELRDIEIRLSAAEMEIAQLRDVNTKLADTNERYESYARYIANELARLAKATPDKFPKDGMPPRFVNEP